MCRFNQIITYILIFPLTFSSVNCHVHVMNEYNKPNKKIVLELFACMLVIQQNDALLQNMATVKHCHHFQYLHLYTFKGGGQKSVCFVHL